MHLHFQVEIVRETTIDNTYIIYIIYIFGIYEFYHSTGQIYV